MLNLNIDHYIENDMHKMHNDINKKTFKDRKIDSISHLVLSVIIYRTQ